MNINERIKIKLENRTNRIICFGLTLLILILSSYRTYIVFKDKEKNENIRAEEIYKSIDKKFNFLNMTIYDLKTSKEFNDYFFEKNKLQNKQYKKLKLFDELKKTNTIYGIIGCSINIIDGDENLVFTSTGTIDKNEYLKDEKFIDLYKRVTNYFLNHLPADDVCYWDLSFDDLSGEEKDSSAAAIAVCGMLEMDKYLPDSDPDKKIYQNAVKRIMNSLIKNYSTKDMERCNGLLKEAVYSKPHGIGVEECCIWGDYFYMEALVRIMKPEWKKYW